MLKGYQLRKCDFVLVWIKHIVGGQNRFLFLNVYKRLHCLTPEDFESGCEVYIVFHMNVFTVQWIIDQSMFHFLCHVRMYVWREKTEHILYIREKQKSIKLETPSFTLVVQVWFVFERGVLFVSVWGTMHHFKCWVNNEMDLSWQLGVFITVHVDKHRHKLYTSFCSQLQEWHNHSTTLTEIFSWQLRNLVKKLILT